MVPAKLILCQNAPSAGFYVDYQFERALKFHEWMANLIHTNNNYRNVGMLEVVNEPIQNSGGVGTMRSTYYPDAFSVRLLCPLFNRLLIDHSESVRPKTSLALPATTSFTSK
jgi:hypothetical protein